MHIQYSRDICIFTHSHAHTAIHIRRLPVGKNYAQRLCLSDGEQEKYQKLSIKPHYFGVEQVLGVGG